MTFQQAEIAKNINEIQAQEVELNKGFSIFNRQVQRHRPAAGSLEQELQLSMIASYIVTLQEEERIVLITYALEGFEQAFQVLCI